MILFLGAIEPKFPTLIAGELEVSDNSSFSKTLYPLLRSAVWMAANLFLEVSVEESPLKSMAPLTYNGKPPLLLSDATCWYLLETGPKLPDLPLECMELHWRPMGGCKMEPEKVGKGNKGL
ncbi:hypothetical protein FKM82_025745 [Ascaphus truei]